jgi:hypothetical protein
VFEAARHCGRAGEAAAEAWRLGVPQLAGTGSARLTPRRRSRQRHAVSRSGTRRYMVSPTVTRCHSMSPGGADPGFLDCRWGPLLSP